jgi:RNA polymerase primary sigma factor
MDIPVAKVRKVPKCRAQSIPPRNESAKKKIRISATSSKSVVVSAAEAAINVNLKDQTGQGPAHAAPAQSKGNQDAVRTGRRRRTHSRRSRPIVRGTRERIRRIEAKALRKLRHPVEVAEVAGVYGWGRTKRSSVG